jgi:hypothetical protein
MIELKKARVATTSSNLNTIKTNIEIFALPIRLKRDTTKTLVTGSSRNPG